MESTSLMLKHSTNNLYYFKESFVPFDRGCQTSTLAQIAGYKRPFPTTDLLSCFSFPLKKNRHTCSKAQKRYSTLPERSASRCQQSGGPARGQVRYSKGFICASQEENLIPFTGHTRELNNSTGRAGETLIRYLKEMLSMQNL